MFICIWYPLSIPWLCIVVIWFCMLFWDFIMFTRRGFVYLFCIYLFCVYLFCTIIFCVNLFHKRQTVVVGRWVGGKQWVEETTFLRMKSISTLGGCIIVCSCGILFYCWSVCVPRWDINRRTIKWNRTLVKKKIQFHF